SAPIFRSCGTLRAGMVPPSRRGSTNSRSCASRPAGKSPSLRTRPYRSHADPAILAIILALTTASAAFAQTGSIHGVVVDTRGGAGVRDVAVRLQADARTISTDADGRFEIDRVPAGEQELYVSAVDFVL